MLYCFQGHKLEDQQHMFYYREYRNVESRGVIDIRDIQVAQYFLPQYFLASHHYVLLKYVAK